MDDVAVMLKCYTKRENTSTLVYFCIVGKNIDIETFLRLMISYQCICVRYLTFDLKRIDFLLCSFRLTEATLIDV